MNTRWISKVILALILMLTILFSSTGIAEKNETAYEDEQYIHNLIEKMSLKDKIEQMIIFEYVGTINENGEKNYRSLSDEGRKFIEDHNFGGVIFFKYNITGTEQILKFNCDLQSAATSQNSKHKIPLFIAADQEGGRVNRLTTGTTMPGNMALGAINDYDTTKEYASIMAEELSVLGFNVDFAPVIDVNNNPNNPVINTRSFSSNPYRVARMGEAFIDGLHSQNISSSLKHFPGHGDTEVDSHTGLPSINKSLEELKLLELVPFEDCINYGADMVMTAHIEYPKIETNTYHSISTGEEVHLPATLSKTILTDILRDELGFEGLIVTDALQMSAITEHFDAKDVAKLAINAGANILLMPPYYMLNMLGKDIDDYVSMICNLVESGEVSEGLINDSVYRILSLKLKRGILKKEGNNFSENFESKLTYAKSTVGSKEHHDKEFEIAKSAITLYKGEDILPLNGNSGKVVFALSNENGTNSILYAIELLKKNGILNDSFEYEIVSFEKQEPDSLKDKLVDGSIYIITSNTTKRADFDINNEDGWQGRSIDYIIEEVHNRGKKAILVSCTLPYDITRYDDADAIICTYGNAVISELPIVYNGETLTFGSNISAGIYKLFSGEKFTASLPVDIYEIDESYEYTDNALFSVE